MKGKRLNRRMGSRCSIASAPWRHFLARTPALSSCCFRITVDQHSTKLCPKNDVRAEPKLFTLLVSEKAVVLSQPKKRLVMTATDGMLSVKIVGLVVHGVDVPTWKAFVEGDKIHFRGSAPELERKAADYWPNLDRSAAGRQGDPYL